MKTWAMTALHSQRENLTIHSIAPVFLDFFSLFVITFTNTVQVFTALELNCGYFSNEFHPLRVRTEWPWHLAGSEVLVAICECTPFSYRVVKSREIFLALSWTAKKKLALVRAFNYIAELAVSHSMVRKSLY